MGYGLNRISPITFDKNAFQTPNNRTQGRVLTSTPRKQGKKSGSPEDQQRQDVQTSSKSYNADTLVRNAGQFIPPGQSNLPDNSPSDSDYVINQTVFQGNTHQKSVSTGNSVSQQSHSAPAPAGATGATQMSPNRDTQVGGTQTSPPPQPSKHTALGGTQTTPSQHMHQDGDTQGNGKSGN